MDLTNIFSSLGIKAVCVSALLLVLPFVAQSQVVYNEDFNLPDGTTIDNGATAWSSSYSGSGTFEKQNWGGEDLFFIYNLDSEGVWTSQSIDISSYGYAIIDIDGYIDNAGAGDYLRFYYSLDGGPEVLFGDFSDGFFIGAVGASSIVSGNAVTITVRAYNNGFFDLYTFDNVVITGITALYSRKSGNWTDAVAGTGTWSVESHSGTACACIPNNLTLALIGNGHTVDMNADGTTAGIEINSGTLRYTAASADLNIDRDYYVQLATGTVDRNGQADARINFSGGAIATLTMDGPLTVDDIDFLAESTLTLTGNGAITVNDDVYFSAVATVINNKTNTSTVTDRIMFNAASGGATFTSNQPLTAGSLYFNASACGVTNNSTLTLTGGIQSNDNGDDDNIVTNASGATLNLVTINPTDADLDILNSGIINQSGNFTNINSTDSNFDNLVNSVWNWTLTPNTTFDTDVAAAMNLTASGNTFNYSGAGAQRIIPTTYHHITLSNSGAKDANNASFAVQGNWNVSGTATFTEGTGTITLNGSVAQTITNAAGETFNNLTINNSFATSPQITLGGNVTVSSVLTMTDGNVNLNGNTFRLSSSATGALSHSLASTAGWMYGGSFARVRPASTTITVGASAHSLFPLGSDGDWRPFFAGQGSVAGTAGTMTVSHTNSTTTSTVAFAESIVRRHDSYWTVSTTATAGTYTLRAGGTNFGTIASNAHIRMSTSTGVVGTHGAGTGGPTDWRVNRTAVPFASLANNYHVASTDATNSPLPIELLSFTAQVTNNFVTLKWATASESNNDFFTIERAVNLEHFEAVTMEDGQGTTKEVNRYQAIDPSPLYGRSYYRLKQTDFDGTYTYSSLQVVDYEGPRLATLTAFPNPLNDQNLTIKIEGLLEATEVTVQISNMVGQKVFEKVIEIKTPGIIVEEIPKHNFPTPGLYMIKAGKTLYLTKKIVVK